MRIIRPTLVATACAIAAGSAAARTFIVDNPADDGSPGTLRWAIQQSNAINLANPLPDGNRIVIGTPAGKRPFVIRPAGNFLPPLVGPVRVQGLRPARRGVEPSVVIDGSNLVAPRTPSACPGATHAFDHATGTWTVSRVQRDGANVRGYYGAALAVHDTHDVEITGLDLRNFCIGVAGVRSHHVNVHHMRIVDHHGAAGVIFTGDDGDAGSTDLSHANRLADSVLLDNGDGFEFTRGTHDSVIEDNHIALTQPLPVDGNAIEFASSGDRNRVIGNLMTAYRITSMTVGSGREHVIRDNDVSGNLSPGASFGGSGHEIRDNNFSDNGGTGVSLGGTLHRFERNRVANNGGVGVNISSGNAQQLTLTRNSIADNTGLGIDIAPAGPNANDSLDADAGPNGGQNHPELDAAQSAWSGREITLAGTLASAPEQTYRIEFFASRNADASGYGEGERYLGNTSVTTDANGEANFTFVYDGRSPVDWQKRRNAGAIPADDAGSAYFSATATDASGATSEFGAAIQLTRTGR